VRVGDKDVGYLRVREGRECRIRRDFSEAWGQSERRARTLRRPSPSFVETGAEIVRGSSYSAFVVRRCSTCCGSAQGSKTHTMVSAGRYGFCRQRCVRRHRARNLPRGWVPLVGADLAVSPAFRGDGRGELTARDLMDAVRVFLELYRRPTAAVPRGEGPSARGFRVRTIV
jgi:hypothetical protein